MILVVDTNLKEVKFWAFQEKHPEEPANFFAKDLEEVLHSRTLKRDIFNLAGQGGIEAISFRILFGGDYFDRASLISRDFFIRFAKLTELFPFYIPLMQEMLKVFFREFPDIPLVAFFETAFFSRLPDEEKYYAIPQEFKRENSIKKWGYHGIFHQADSGMLSRSGKCISVVFDRQTTVCAVKEGRPYSISLGYTPLEGVMSRTSCGDLDPGIVFYLMNVQNYSIYRIDDMLKKESGFLGLTGYDLEMKELVRFLGRDPKVDLAFEVYQAQLLKFIGEGIAVLGGLDYLVFAGGEVDQMIPVIHSLIKKVAFLGISTRGLPWEDKKPVSQISARDSRIKVYLNRMSLPEVVFYETGNFLHRNFPKGIRARLPDR